MQLFSSISSVRFRQDSFIHLALGSFDGLHLGHQALLRQMPLGQGPKVLCGVLTFSPHPSKILRPHAPTALLMPPSQQENHFRALKLDFLIRHPFDHTFAQTPALAFLDSLKIQMPSLVALYVGESFRFGRQRTGDVPLMADWARGAGVALQTLALFKQEGQPVSSSKIRSLIQAGRLSEAHTLLGYAYYAEGKLEQDHQGLFVSWAPELQPPAGLYTGCIPKLGKRVNLRYTPGKIMLDIEPQHWASLRGSELRIEFTSLQSLC